ncbi:MAG TPA: tRNA (adenosine(37)-N6)-threonylcarbamoyltransferase complex transferase subunit TsaD [Alphaproteobacteria bacterium]|nr:tRNA (adenosine(37)-N6)-threonylcarbamoyltransferase complex transferase subunit TsaD [Alphaproteobacteria bacterium]
MIVLGIETSCDETAAALVNSERKILAHAVLSQTSEHLRFGGVVPEIAARAHLTHLDSLITRCLSEAGLNFDALDGIAATCGPGLIGGVMVGAMTAKALALGLNKPFIAVNHLEAHALTPRLTNDVAFPYLLLLISGGHCQLLAVEGVGRYRLYGTTLDDAVGEAFDKVAKLLELGFPGGPAVERAAKSGDAKRFEFPQPMLGKKNMDFSFSGLKTAVRHLVHEKKDLSAQDKADIAASFQRVIANCLADRTARAISAFKKDYPAGKTLVAAGGVAANQMLGKALADCAAAAGLEFCAPPPALCTDNGAMVAWAGLEKLRLGQMDGLDFAPRPRWPLSEGTGNRV